VIAELGGVVGSVGLAVLLLAPRREARIAGLAGWTAGMALLAGHLAPEGHHRVLAAAAVLGAVAAGGLAWIFRRQPWLVAVLTLACVPARIPVHVGATEANLLLPLYLVVLACAMALAWELFGEEPRSRELGPLAWPVALLVLLNGVSILWTKDLRQGAIELVFFLLPFGLLAVAIARLPWSRGWLTFLAVQLSVMGVVFAAIGAYQYLTRDVFWNPKLIVDNSYAPSGWFYRVNSVFYDPSIYGRFLVVAILAALVVALTYSRLRVALAAAGVVVVTWLGLLPSFSQSSFLALLTGVAGAAAFLWGRRVLPLALVVVLVVVAAGVAVPSVRHEVVGKSKSGWSRATGGRSKLFSNGVKVAADHPVVGVGVGGFKRAYADRVGLKGKDPKKAASHNAAITVAAETGVGGLALLAWLVLAAGAVSLRGLRRGFTSHARLAFGLALAAILVHSFFYNALFEDPTFWGLLGLAVVGSRAREEPA
jgi:putative inorganic carbon (HCO3(-)) transporter